MERVRAFAILNKELENTGRLSSVELKAIRKIHNMVTLTCLESEFKIDMMYKEELLEPRLRLMESYVAPYQMKHQVLEGYGMKLNVQTH